MPKTKNILATTKMECEAKLEKLKSEIGITSLLSLYVLAWRNKIKKYLSFSAFFSISKRSTTVFLFEIIRKVAEIVITAKSAYFKHG